MKIQVEITSHIHVQWDLKALCFQNRSPLCFYLGIQGHMPRNGECADLPISGQCTSLFPRQKKTLHHTKTKYIILYCLFLSWEQ